MNTEKKNCCNGCRHGAEGQNAHCKAKQLVANAADKNAQTPAAQTSN